MLRKRMHLLPVAAAAVAALFSTGASALDFHGYVRAGSGATSGGGNQSCFQLPGAYSKYRLGNECETYGEIALDQNVYDGKDGVKFDYHIMFGYKSNYDSQQDFEDLTKPSNDRHWSLRQNWVEAKNLPFLGGGSVWVGKRYYKREDVHITDFFYRDTSGYGVGVENIAAGPGKFSYALFRNNDTPDVAMTRHDLRYDGVSLGGMGSLDFGLNINSGDARNAGVAKNGVGVHIEHAIPVLGGFNKLALQYGQGSLSNMAWAYPDYGAGSDKKTWRLVEMLQWEFSPAFTGMFTAVYQDQKDNYKWTSIGVRPVWHFNDYFKLQGELGYDRVKPTGGTTRNLTKFTIAPTIVAGRGFWARPELRVFATRASWNDAARNDWGGVAGGTTGRFGTGTSGTTYGFQVEAWW